MKRYIVSEFPKIRNKQDVIKFVEEKSGINLDIVKIIVNYMDYDTKWLLGDANCLKQNVESFEYFRRYFNDGKDYKVESKNVNNYYKFSDGELNWYKLFYLTQKLTMMYDESENDFYEFLVTKDFHTSNKLVININNSHISNIVTIKTEEAFYSKKIRNRSFGCMVNNLLSYTTANKIKIVTNFNLSWKFDNSYGEDNKQYNTPLKCSKLTVPSLKGFTANQLINVKKITINHLYGTHTELNHVVEILSNLPNLQKLKLKGESFVQYSALSKKDKAKFESFKIFTEIKVNV
jgi:hypothetical protein